VDIVDDVVAVIGLFDVEANADAVIGGSSAVAA
jgi:hypothetical protein